IDAELCRDRIHQALAHERALKASRCAISAAWRLVGQANTPCHVIGADAVGAEQHGGGKVGYRHRVGAHIGALIVKELAVNSEQPAGSIDRSTDTIMLFAGMIGGDQMFAPILDPFYWTAQPQCAETGEHV